MTAELLVKNENVTLFEATFIAGQKVVRVDILEKKGKTLNIIEVKSKSHDSDDDDYAGKKKLVEHIEDVTYQTLVVKELYPGSDVHSYLYLPDKTKRTSIEGLAGWFTVSSTVEEKFEMEELPAQSGVGFQKPLVEFKYETHKDRDGFVKQLTSDNLLSLVCVDKEVKEITGTIQNRINQFLEIIKGGCKPEHYSINKSCKECEFNLGGAKNKNGYRECWQELTDVDPHIFDLFFGGAIGHYKSGWYLDELIKKKKVSLWDIDPARFKNAKGELGSRGQRQLIQYDNAKANQEFIGDGLATALKQLKYPLHFIDFETYLGAIPHHKGMRPYELVAFQWSCHTINAPGADPIHSEFLNTEYL